MSTPRGFDPEQHSNPKGPDEVDRTRPKGEPGKPARLTEALVDRIAKGLAQGQTKRIAAALAGSNEAQLSTWLKRARLAIEEERAEPIDLCLVTKIERGEALYQSKTLTRSHKSANDKAKGTGVRTAGSSRRAHGRSSRRRLRLLKQRPPGVRSSVSGGGEGATQREAPPVLESQPTPEEPPAQPETEGAAEQSS